MDSEKFNDTQTGYIYPNPATDVINIAIGTPNSLPKSFSIYNALGQVVVSKNITLDSDLKIDVNGMNPGIYFIKIEKDNAFKTFKFIKK